MYVSVQTFGRIGQVFLKKLANSKLTWLLTLLHVAFVAQDKRYSIRLKKARDNPVQNQRFDETKSAQ